METLNVKINEIVKVWPLVSRFVSVPHTEEQYENAVKMLDELIEKIGEDENHPLASLMDSIKCQVNYSLTPYCIDGG